MQIAWMACMHSGQVGIQFALYTPDPPKPLRCHAVPETVGDYVQVVNRYIDQGTAELVPGVLFIDEACAHHSSLFLAHSNRPDLQRKNMLSGAAKL